MLWLLSLSVGALVGLLLYPWNDPMDFRRAERVLTGPPQAYTLSVRWTDRLLNLVHYQPDPESRLGRDLALAGSNMTLADIYVYRVLGLAGGLLLGGLVLAIGDTLVGMLLLVGGVAAWSLPESRTKAEAKRIRAEVNRRLPAFLQALAMMTEAGMNLPPALDAFYEREESALGRELGLALSETAMGVPMALALMNMAKRCNVDDLYRVMAALVQATERGGSGLTDTCRAMASEAWLKRKDAAREVAQQASTKMFLPLFLLVLPTLFLFMMGPSIFQMLRNF
ncbi:MAG: type II secretion system F family protein [Mycobacterium leprae]